MAREPLLVLRHSPFLLLALLYVLRIVHIPNLAQGVTSTDFDMLVYMHTCSYMHQTTSRKNIVQKISETAAAFRVLSDPTRLSIICLLRDNPEGMCVYEIADAVGVSHSAASHQLAKLEARGFTSSYREGQSVCYSLTDTRGTKRLITILNAASLQ